MTATLGALEHVTVTTRSQGMYDDLIAVAKRVGLGYEVSLRRGRATIKFTGHDTPEHQRALTTIALAFGLEA